MVNFSQISASSALAAYGFRVPFSKISLHKCSRLELFRSGSSAGNKFPQCLTSYEFRLSTPNEKKTYFIVNIEACRFLLRNFVLQNFVVIKYSPMNLRSNLTKLVRFRGLFFPQFSHGQRRTQGTSNQENMVQEVLEFDQ